MPSHRHTTTTMLTAALLVAPLLAGCGSAGGPQSSPEAVVRAGYQDIAAGRFEDACHLILPGSEQTFALAGTDCQTYIARRYDPQARTALRNVKIDSSQTRRNGDTAVVPESAVTFGGRPSTDHDNPTARQDGKWWITFSQDSTTRGD